MDANQYWQQYGQAFPFEVSDSPGGQSSAFAGLSQPVWPYVAVASDQQQRAIKMLGGSLMVGLVVVGLTGFLSNSRFPAFRKSAYARTQMGMTRQEVIAVVGVAPGSYRSSLFERQWLIPIDQIVDEQGIQDWKGRRDHWFEEYYGIVVAYDANGKVAGKSLLYLRPSTGEPDWVQWLRNQLP